MKKTDVKLCGRFTYPFFFSCPYTYQNMERDLIYLKEKYSKQIRLTSLATTADNRKVYCIRLGRPDAKKKIIVQAAMHAREWLNTPLLLAMTEHFCKEVQEHKEQAAFLREISGRVCFYLIPMVNPDGVTISQSGWKGIHDAALQQNVKRMVNEKRKNARRWKANARGVDLNRNFEAGFASHTALRENGQEYAGREPLSEVEAQALYELVCRIQPCAVINYHQTGELIYYERAKQPALLLHSLTEYPLCRLADCPNGNFGDWLTQMEIDWCTIESCTGNAPVNSRQYFSLYQKHRDLLEALAEWYG